jgi:hypothetical protein
MEATIGRVLTFLMAAGTATSTALMLGYVAHYDLGFSREEIRTPAVIAATIIAVLIAVEFFGEKFGKPK